MTVPTVRTLKAKWCGYYFNPAALQSSGCSVVSVEYRLAPDAKINEIHEDGFDPLRDEGKAFADRLTACGVMVEHVCYTDMIHGFVSFAGGIPAGMQAIEAMSLALKQALPR